MKTLLRPTCAFRCVPLTLAALLCISGCGKRETETPVRSPSKEGGRPSVAAAESAEKTSFDEVTSHLDAGGSLYGYLATEQWLRDLSTKVESWREPILALPGIESGEREEYAKAFDLVTRLITNSGVEKITGVGVSGIALEPGLYQTKVFVHHNPDQGNGYLWSIAGTKPQPLNELDWLPADTVWAAFGSTDLAMVWDILKRETDEARMTAAKAGFAQLDQQVTKATGSDLATLLATLGGQQGVVLTLDAVRTIRIPLPGDSPVEIPDPALLIAVKVKDDTLFDLIDHALQSKPRVVRSDENGLRCLSMQVPAPLPMTLLPTVARYGDYLFLASNDKIVRAVASVQKGETQGLRSSPEFQRLASGMPDEGNNFTFVSERLGRTVKDVQQQYVIATARSNNAEKAPFDLLRKLCAGGPAVSCYAVGSIGEDGWMRVSHGNQEPGMSLLAPMVIAPAAIVAAVALPAMAKAKAKAQSISCMNNLKQIGLAAFLWSQAHNDALPPDFLAMKDELATPRVLFCPADKKAPDVKSVTWENLDVDTISYEFVSPGLSVTNAGVADKVLVRCPIHGHTLMGDGHVEWGDAAVGR